MRQARTIHAPSCPGCSQPIRTTQSFRIIKTRLVKFEYAKDDVPTVQLGEKIRNEWEHVMEKEKWDAPLQAAMTPAKSGRSLSRDERWPVHNRTCSIYCIQIYGAKDKRIPQQSIDSLKSEIQSWTINVVR